MEKNERVLTTGEVANYCHVHFRTVIRWIEKGRLKGYKLPGRGNNRIEEKDFLLFLKENNLPIPEEFRKQNNRVLIVDDDKEMASAINRILVRSGYNTQVANNGFQAGNMLSEFDPALVTLDLNMPGVDGFEVLNFIQHQHPNRFKIVVISAMDEKNLVRAKTLGANICLPKPFDKSELVSVISSLLEE